MSQDNTTESNKYHGKPCKNCGETLRYKSDYGCVDCKQTRSTAWQNNNPQRWAEIKQRSSQKTDNKKRRSLYQRELRRKLSPLGIYTGGAGGEKITPESKINKKARGMVRTEILNGRLRPVKLLKCADCGKQARYYHHEDYSNPLEVIPLCASCHGYRHSPYPK